MAEGDGASIDIETFPIDRELPETGNHLGSKRFIQFYQVKILKASTCLFQQLADGGDRTDAHSLGLDAGACRCTQGREYWPAFLDGQLFFSDHNGTSTIGDPR